MVSPFESDDDPDFEVVFDLEEDTVEQSNRAHGFSNDSVIVVFDDDDPEESACACPR